MTDQISSYLETLVGEGKKYKDAEELAKGYINADLFIDKLKQEKTETEIKLSQHASLAELLQQAQATPPAAPSVPEVTPPVVQPDTQVNTQEPVDIEKALDSLLARKEQESRQRLVAETITSQFNNDKTKISEFLTAKAAQLGVPITWFDSIAAQSSDAALELLGLTSKAPKQTTGIPATLASTQVGTQSGEVVRNFDFYNKLRQTNPRMFNSPEMQRQKLEDLARLGREKFYQS